MIKKLKINKNYVKTFLFMSSFSFFSRNLSITINSCIIVVEGSAFNKH